ncbi:MAG: protein kinase [candidate division Zixibacteria bacterium]|nr:protein kinase [candidate division Zixibacteria bacterium]
MIGKTISHYKILEKLGEGGMGVVYKAQDIKLDRLVALKFLPPHLTSEPVEKERFIHEAKAASALSHTNITTIHEIDEFEGQMFIVMEYCEGNTLKHIIDKETLTIKKVLDIGIQLCEGLALAHEKGIVHRDIKSDNIMLTPRGQVKIMDFGLAKLKGATKLTKTRSTLGTLAYMSPEQAQGEEVDSRSDIFSFGVVLYELLTGKLPFAGEHQAAVIYSIINEEPQPIARFNNQVSAKLEDMVYKALAKEKDERYQHIDDLLADLRRERKNLDYLKTGVTPKPTDFPKPVKKRAFPLMVGLMAILILIVVYLVFLRQKEPTTAGKPSIAVLYLRNLSENKEDDYFASGMTEDIITQLSQIAGLLIASRSDIEQFKNKPINLKEVADKLRVKYIMEGSVQKYRDKVRITCQLIKASDGFHVWAASYDRQMEDLFAIQADVAKAVAQALKVALAPVEVERIEKKPTLNVQAYNYYLQGREYYFSGGSTTKEGLELSTKMFQKALEADSNFALAYAGLSDCYSSYVMMDIDRKKSWLEKARGSSSKALALDPDLAEAHRSLSRLYWTEGKREKAIQEAEEAVKANPNYGEGWKLLGAWYTYTGQYPKAESALMKTLETKPTETTLFGAFIMLYSRLGKNEKVEEYFNKGLEIQPTNYRIYSTMSTYYLGRGELEQAKKMAYKSLDINPQYSSALATLSYIFGISGEADSSLFYLDEYRKQSPGEDWFVELGSLELMKGNKKQAEIYLDSGIQFNLPLIKEFQGLPNEYYSRLRIALAYALRGESKKAMEQANRVKQSLGESLLKVEWYASTWQLSFVYSLTGQKQEAVRMLDFYVKNNILTTAYIKLHPWYKNLAGYPAFEELIKGKTK